MQDEYILEMLDIVKIFPGVRALNGVQLKVRPGTVHALMGENGAGKSTLMKCLIGMQKPTSGEIIYKGKKVDFNNTKEALEAGISMIHQELSPVPERSVLENVWLGHYLRKGFLLDNKKMREECIKLFDYLKIDIDPDEKMGNLTVAKMQMVEISKALLYDSQIIIMDEPTSALTDKEVNQLFTIIEDLKAKNVSIIYISHKMDEIFKISDDITIYCDGRYVASKRASELDIDQLITLMVGRKIDTIFPKVESNVGDVIFKVEDLCFSNKVKNVSFELHKGEILGFAGLVGAGRTETMETIFGLNPKSSGKIFKNGKELNIQSPEDAVKNGIGLLTEDRRKSGIVGILDIRNNIILANLKKYGFPLNYHKINSDAEEYSKKLRIKSPSIYTKIQNLSGGNQQKTLIARWLLTEPDILIIDEPTRGIDIGAKSEIYELISTLASQGMAIIMVSSELPEVMAMSDRMIVLHEGRITGIIEEPNEVAQEVIMSYATGHTKNA